MTRAARMEEARDLCDCGPDRESFREPGPGEVACDCAVNEGIVYWVEGFREGVDICGDCKGSGVMPAPEAEVHPIFASLLSPFAPRKVA
jgi:hypothetical protein